MGLEHKTKSEVRNCQVDQIQVIQLGYELFYSENGQSRPSILLDAIWI